MMTIIKSYSEMIKIFDFEERYKYLKLDGVPFDSTFGSHRYMNQILYKSPKWKSIRREVILRDDGCDMAHADFPIMGSIYIHHINPITIDDILDEKDCIFDLNNLVSVSYKTHLAIHYGEISDIPKSFIERSKNDTCLWK